MKIRFIHLLLLVQLAALQACFKEDEQILPHPRGGVTTDTIAMTELYTYQLYYSLDSAQVVRQNVKTAADLGFECTPDGWRVILNSANFMKAVNLGKVDFGGVYDTLGKKLLFDKSDGNPDSTAIDQWFTVKNGDTVSNGNVYGISRGLDESGNPLGLYQVIFDSLKRGTYYFRYAPLSGGATINGEAEKSTEFHYQWFSLKTGTMQNLEPPKIQYDLLFTQYTTLLFTNEGIPYPYLLTGVLINRSGTSVALDSVNPFHAINLNSTIPLLFSSEMDKIGWDWKDYDFNAGVYTIVPGRSYIIRTQSGYTYKLRFIGFYDKNGSKGYPVIEFQAL